VQEPAVLVAIVPTESNPEERGEGEIDKVPEKIPEQGEQGS